MLGALSFGWTEVPAAVHDPLLTPLCVLRDGWYGMGHVRRMGSVVLLLGCASLATSCNSGSTATQTPATKPPSYATSAHPTVAPVTGKWVNPTAAVTVSSTGGLIKQRSGTVWSGDLDGTTTFSAVLRA